MQHVTTILRAINPGIAPFSKSSTFEDTPCRSGFVEPDKVKLGATSQVD